MYIEPYLNIARLFMEVNALHMAEPYARKIIDVDPDNIEAHNILGIITNLTDRPDEAVGHFQDVLKSDANQPGVFSNLGTAYRDTGDKRRAIIAFEKAIELNPHILTAHNNLGVLYRENGDFDKAETLFRHSIKLFPENPFSYFNLAELYIATGDYAKALDNLKRYIDIVPLDMDNLFKTIGIARMADRLGDVVPEMERFIGESASDDSRSETVRQWLSMAERA